MYHTHLLFAHKTEPVRQTDQHVACVPDQQIGRRKQHRSHPPDATAARKTKRIDLDDRLVKTGCAGNLAQRIITESRAGPLVPQSTDTLGTASPLLNLNPIAPLLFCGINCVIGCLKDLADIRFLAEFRHAKTRGYLDFFPSGKKRGHQQYGCESFPPPIVHDTARFQAIR